MDTIFALASAEGRAGVAVLRVSGALSVSGVSALCDVPAQRGLRRLYNQDGLLLDQAFVLRFDAGRSFTGEETVELHLHGSIAVVRAVLGELGALQGFRQAEPGEFTRRALENGVLDLAQVEGLADLIDAETEHQRKQALRVLSGALGEKAANWRDKLIRAAALIEATIDFADEDVPIDVFPEVRDLLSEVCDDMNYEAAGVAAAEKIRSGFEVAILGRPNVGKSTLLNKIARRDAAITSDIAGTTRDIIEVHTDLGGVSVTFLDTAGLRETDDPVEKLGVARAEERARLADLRIYMQSEDDSIPQYIDEQDIIVAAKSDIHKGSGLAVSGKTGLGVDQLLSQISEIFASRVGHVGVAMRERHRVVIQEAASHLTRVLENIADSVYPADIIAEDIRSACRAVDSLIGRVDVESVLGEIFSSFCIGK
jgi:tRNA modification GTPase